MEYEPGVRDALLEVQGRGMLDGNEHLMILRDGKVVYTNDGDSEHVGYDKFAGSKPGDILVHNHPDSLNALSNGDIVQLFGPRKIGVIYCITEDSSVYRASRKDEEVSARGFMRLWELAWHELVGQPMVYRAARTLALADHELNEAHWANRMVASKGAIDYQYALGKETRKLAEVMDQKIDFPRLIARFDPMDDPLDAFMALAQRIMKGES